MARNAHRVARAKVKKSADNEFSALTGVRAIQVQNPTMPCLVTKQGTADGHPIAKFAYLAYNGLLKAAPKRITSIKVTQSCGTTNCVCKGHLVAEDPLKDAPPWFL